MKLNISEILFPTIIGITVYIIIDRLFPEKAKSFKTDSLKDLRGGGKLDLVKRIAKKISEDRALKIALLSVFAAAGMRNFQSEIETLLTDDVFNQICIRDTDGDLKIVCDIVKEHELNVHTKSLKSLIVENNLNQEQKISLLKIKLDYIINGECEGKTRFLIVAMLGAILTCTISGVGGLSLILEALYRLFQEGKIGKALYKKILKALAKRSGRKNVYASKLISSML